MPKATAIVRSGNAGEISVLMEGRTDWDRYAASMRTLLNFVAAQQGPMLRRSGTIFTIPAFDHDRKSALLPFVFNNEQAQCVEFAHQRIRFVDEQGVLTYTPVSVSSVVTESPFVVNAPGLGAAVNDQVALASFPTQLNVNGQIATVTAVAGDNYTLDMTYANPGALDITGSTVARVYHVASTYAETDVQNIRVLQSVDVLYLFCDGHVPRTLSRNGATDWTLADIEFSDGPYMEPNNDGVKLTPAATGNAATNSTGTASMSGTPTAGKEPSKAFDEDLTTYWESDTNQTGRLIFDPTTDFACTGYAIHIASDNSDTSFTAKDYAPGDFEFQGYDGTNWITLDVQLDYVLYDGNRSAFFELNNDTVYQQYALDIKSCTRNGSIKPRVAALTLTSDASATFDITASAVTGINGGDGFVSTDVGRLIRLKGRDTMWRPARITSITSTTVVTVKLLSSPLPNVEAITSWRMGYWSDTTGWPTTGIFYDDRLVMGGAEGAPDLVVGSVTGAYTNLSPTDPLGEVLAESAFAVQLQSRQLARVRWIETDERGLLMGTGSGEWVITAPDNASALGPLNIRARRTSRRGSASITPVAVDKQVLYLQRARRTVREMSYVFESDGYKAPSMSIFASHIGSDRFGEIEYAPEPHSIAWLRQDSGKLAGLTYNREENVIGWHRHDLGGEVESICVIPANDERQDILWLVIKRTVDGQTRRYIERLAPFWDFDSDISTAHYVDSGLSATFGTPVDTIYGLWHLEGLEVYGLADGVPFDKRTVTNGSILLDQEASSVTIGLPFTSEGETSRIDVGAADGTAQGKEKRIHNVVISLWDSDGGEIGVYNDETGQIEYDAVEYSEAPYDEIETNELYTGMVGPITVAPGYSERGSVAFRQSEPLPFNVIAIIPQLHTQDR